MENREVMGIGWPLGLGSMHMRLRLLDSLTLVPVPEPRQRSTLYVPSSSFSSFSSSNLDTESTASFFQDNSRTLGRLIGIRSRNRRSELYLQNPINGSVQPQRLSRNLPAHKNQYSQDRGLDMEMCSGLCVPLCLVVKTSSNKGGSKR